MTGFTPNELAKRWWVSPDRIRAWICAGRLSAINVGNLGKRQRFVCLPEHVAAFEAQQAVGEGKKKRITTRLQKVEQFIK